MKDLKKALLGLTLAVAACCSFTSHAQSRLYPNEFDLSDVTLLDGPMKHAMDLNVKVLLDYDTDRLLAPFLKEAGLKPKAPSFSCWDGLDGHVGGHYLSALAIHYAATGNPQLKERMDYVISQLEQCEAASPDGYIGGVPAGRQVWDRIAGGDPSAIWDRWVPWYNVHKLYAGLRDAWLYAGSDSARRMFLKMADWALRVTANLSDRQMEDMLNNEFGGMPEVLADAYQITRDERYLTAAKRFAHRRLLDSMAAGIDNLDNMHANTQVPKAVGYQRIGELSGDPTFNTAAQFFWHTVTANRSLSIGGNSRREHFPSKDDCKSYVDDREGPESCNTYNMLRLTEGLFRQNPSPRYADYYERALFNHILSTQHPDHGGYVYFTSARPGHYRVYSQPNSGMWCCVGTGMENHGKYGQFIYTRGAADTLRVNLFIPSRLTWKERGITLTQLTEFPDKGHTSLTLSTRKARKFPLALRHPAWADSLTILLNGRPYATSTTPGSYVTINRKWRNGDRIELSMPMPYTIEELPNLPSYISILRGPIVMAERYPGDTPGLIADSTRWAHIAHGHLVSVFDTPIAIGSRKEILENLDTARLEPFYALHDSRYILYRLSMTADEYDRYKTRQQRLEQEMLLLDARTLDAVNTGEQQPEADHFMTQKRTHSGHYQGRPWRGADPNGEFAYRLSTKGETNLGLHVSYWGNEIGNATVEILADGQAIATQPVGEHWKKNEFVDITYPLPSALLQGKQNLTVTFRAPSGAPTGAVYHVRLVRP